jgi:lysozyme
MLQMAKAEPSTGRTGLIALGAVLLGLVGAPTAGLLFTETPKEESGRKVEVQVQPTGVTIQHISGPQHLRAYLDIVKVPTACDGITDGVKMGAVYTEAQCAAMLEAALAVHAKGVLACTPTLAPNVPGRDHLRYAMISLAYNVGVSGYCRSSIPRKIAAGQIRAACDTLLSFNKAGGRVVRGLDARRRREWAICVKDA